MLIYITLHGYSLWDLHPPIPQSPKCNFQKGSLKLLVLISTYSVWAFCIENDVALHFAHGCVCVCFVLFCLRGNFPYGKCLFH